MDMKCDKPKFFQIAASTVRVGEIEMPILFGLDQNGQIWKGYQAFPNKESFRWEKMAMPEEKQ